MGEPLITIGITCYREGEWLRECWESVLDQTDDRWEAVLVMDGTDHGPTREVFARLEHPRLRKVALPENVGPYPTRNKAFELTRTPYHLYLDGDDQLAPGAVALLLDGFARRPDAAVVYGDYAIFREGAEAPVHFWRYPRALRDDLYADAQPIPAGSAYRRSLWEALGGFAQELARGNGDYDFLIGAAEAGHVAVHCGAAHYRYRAARGERVSKSYDRRYHETHEIMVARHPRFFANPRRRDRFLSLGERRAALACYAAGDDAGAAALARAAIGRGLRGDARLWSVLAAATLRPLPRRALTAATRALGGSSQGRDP